MDSKITSEKMLIEPNEKNSSLIKSVINPVEKPVFIKEINAHIINAVEFCSNILSRNGLGSYMHINRFITYIDIAATEIKFLLNSNEKLMQLLCSFPLVFHVVGNEVTLRNWIIFHLNQQEWLKELLVNSFHLVPIFITAVQFYCNELFKITPKFELPIQELFGHKSKAPEVIRAVTRNINEFILFLKLYPEIFHLQGDKVSLSKSAVSYRSLKKWVRRLLVNDFFLMNHNTKEKNITDSILMGMKSYELLRNEVSVYEAVGFHYKFILNNGSTKGISLKKLYTKSCKVVTMSTFIKNIVDFELFLNSYPEIFALNNKIVFLSQLYSYVAPTIAKDQLNCSTSSFNGLDIKNQEQTAINFYLDLLNSLLNMPLKITECPINHLVYYNVIAPLEVKRIAKSAKELKKFLSQYPQIFKINNADNIVLVETDVSETNEKLSTSNDSSIKDKRIFHEKLKEAVCFYANVLNELGGTAKIERLLDYKWPANKEVQSIATSSEELKNFFCYHQNDFIVVNDTVCLRNMNKEVDFDVNLLINGLKPKATENAISFYSNVLSNHKSRIVSIIRISGHRGSAPADVKNVAKNPKELKTFFSQFPKVFTIVDDDKVMLSNSDVKISTSHHQPEIFFPEKFCKESEQCAIEFFSKMLNHHGICRVLSINKLFEFKLKSSPAIQKIVGSTIKEFLDFLMKYPQEFLVTNDNVIARKKIPKWSYNGKYENKKFTDPLLLLIFNFFKMYTSNKSIFHINYLYNNVGRFFLYNDETPVFPSKSDLLLFLGLYPHVFFVDYYRIVNIIASSRKAFVCDYKRRQFRFEKKQNNQNISGTKKSEISKPIVTNSQPPPNLSVTSLDNETKTLREGNILNKIETKKKHLVKSPVQPKKGIPCRLRKNKITKMTNKVIPIIKPSPSEESLLSELSKNNDEDIETKFNSSNLESEDDFLNNQNTPCWSDSYEREFNPTKIEDIENNILVHFVNKVNKNKHLPKNYEDHTPCHTDLMLNGIFPKDCCRKEDFEKLVMEALMFLNGKLWEGGILRIINIEELFNSFSKSGFEMSLYCCKSIKEFQDFLCKFPYHFIISQKNVMARKNKITKINYVLNNEDESLPIILFNFFNLYTKHFNYILLKLLYSQVGKYFCNINRCPFFKCLGDLVLFLEMFPEVFCIDNHQVINLTVSKENVFHKVKFNSGVIKIGSFLDQKLYSTIANEKNSTVPESIEGWKDYVLQRTEIIEDLNQCRVVTAEILNSQRVIALDCEGVNLGAAGILTLMQIGLANGQVYIFDIIKETSMVNEGGIKDILESKSIIKVIHDSRNDVANLYTEYGVKIAHIFDTRVAHHLIVNKGVSSKKISNKLTTIGFNELCSKYGANLNVQKDEMKNVYKSNASYWAIRPLTKDMLAYAALDVASLVPQIFFTMLKQLKGIPEKSLWELSGKHSLSVLNNKDLLFD